MISPHKTPALAKLAMLLLFAIAAVAILDTTSISAQELGRTITSPFGIARQTSTSESGSEGDTFVDPETGEVGHIIRNPFGQANPDGVDTGIDIPDSGEEVGGIITSPFGVPASDDIDTGVDVFDEDEEYLISLPEDEESDAEESENVDEVDDETSDDEKEIGEESEEDMTEKALPIIDNPTRGVEYTIELSLTGSTGAATEQYSIESTTGNINDAPTLYVTTGSKFTLTVASTDNQTLVKENISFYFDGTHLDALSGVFENKLYLSGSSTLTSHTFRYNVSSNVYSGTHNVAILYHYNSDETIVRYLKIEIIYFSFKIDYNGDKEYDDYDVYPSNSFGKLIHINNLDGDNDGIPDYADGFVCNGYINGTGNQPIAISNIPQNTDGNDRLPFEKIIIRISKNINPVDWKVCFSYNETDLDVNVYQNTGYVGSQLVTFQTFEPRDKKNKINTTMRIWGKDGVQARSRNKINATSNPGDFIPSNVYFPLEKLNDTKEEPENCPYYEYILYIEAVKPLLDTAVIGETIKVSLRKNENTNIRLSDSIVATSYQVVFEGITNDKYSGGSHSINYNPCSLEKGGFGKFHFETIPASIPNSFFSWRSNGSIIFMGGLSIGKEVYVQAKPTASDYWLEVDIGRGNNNPKVEGPVLETKTVNIYIWIVGDPSVPYDPPAWTETEVYSLVNRANDIYKQVGMIFHIEGINYMPSDYFLDYDIPNIQIVDNSTKAEMLTTYPQKETIQRGPGLEIFFVQKLYALGLTIYIPHTLFSSGSDSEGIIIPKTNLEGYTGHDTALAHELGHACGLDDIYQENGGISDSLNSINVNSLWIEAEDHAYGNGDSAIMSATGYYRYNLKHKELIGRLLMLGGQIQDKPDSDDISGGNVFGYKNVHLPAPCPVAEKPLYKELGRPKTGLKDMNRTPTHKI